MGKKTKRRKKGRTKSRENSLRDKIFSTESVSPSANLGFVKNLSKDNPMMKKAFVDASYLGTSTATIQVINYELVDVSYSPKNSPFEDGSKSKRKKASRKKRSRKMKK